MNKVILIVFILFADLLKGQSQNYLDALLASLDNKDLYIAPIIYGSNIGIVKKNVNQDSLRQNRPLFRVSSLPVDIEVLAKKYSKEVLVRKLYAFLQDMTRDFYASALLYDLLDNHQLGKLASYDRQKWMQSGKRLDDVGYWGKYLRKEKYIKD